LLEPTAVTGLLHGTNYWNGLLERISWTDWCNGSAAWNKLLKWIAEGASLERILKADRLKELLVRFVRTDCCNGFAAWSKWLKRIAEVQRSLERIHKADNVIEGTAGKDCWNVWPNRLLEKIATDGNTQVHQRKGRHVGWLGLDWRGTSQATLLKNFTKINVKNVKKYLQYWDFWLIHEPTGGGRKCSSGRSGILWGKTHSNKRWHFKDCFDFSHKLFWS
jgi:hypothetical protein